MIDIKDYPVERLKTRDGSKVLFVNRNNNPEETDPSYYYCVVVQGASKSDHKSIWVSKSGNYIKDGYVSFYDVLVMPKAKCPNLEDHLTEYPIGHPKLGSKDGKYTVLALVKKDSYTDRYVGIVKDNEHNTTHYRSYFKSGEWVYALNGDTDCDLVLKEST